MDISASDIYSFYQSKLGGLVKRTIRQKIISSIDETKHIDVCGYGYVSPYLSFINKHFPKSNVIEFRPDFLDGAVKETVDFNQKFIHEYFLPLEPSMVDVVVSTHLLEFVEKPQSSIEEIWRILRPNGYFISILPRRSGIWTRYDNNPFGFGRSYSSSQFKNLIDNYFVLDKKNSFLHFPPWGHYLNYKFYQTFENLGNHIFPYMGGLMVCVCKKIVYAKTTSTSKKIPIKNVLTT